VVYLEVLELWRGGLLAVDLTVPWVARVTYEVLDVVGLDVVRDVVLDVVGLDVVLWWGQLHSSTAYSWDSSAGLGSRIPSSRRFRAGSGTGTRRRWARSG